MPSTSSSRNVARFYLRLPVELIREIMKNAIKRDLAKLALVSKTFHDLAMPVLYHHIYLDMDEIVFFFISCLKASMDNAKYIAVLYLQPHATRYFDRLMSVPGLKPHTLFFATYWGGDDYDPVFSSSHWDARPKHIAVMLQSFSPNSWISQRKVLFSHLTHLYLEDLLDDDILSFCLELRSLTHICVTMDRDMDSIDALRQIHGFLGMPSMELVVIHTVETEYLEYIDIGTVQVNGMGFPTGELFPILAEIPDERLHMYPKPDRFEWFMYGITPWNLGGRLTMPWRDAVRAP